MHVIALLYLNVARSLALLAFQLWLVTVNVLCDVASTKTQEEHINSTLQLCYNHTDKIGYYTLNMTSRFLLILLKCLR